jgi:hypothetical protein
MRFYRRVRLGKGATLNLGKTGASISLGVRGAHMTFGGAGGTRATVGIPGTGLFWTHNFTTAKKQKDRYEAKQQRDAANAAERQQRALERERKRREREQAVDRAVREKQMQLAALKSEFEGFQAYIADLSSFHKIDMVCGEQAQAEFRNRCELRTYENIQFPFEDTAKSISVYHYPGKPESSHDGKPVEAVLRENNEEFRDAMKNITTLRNIENLSKRIDKDSIMFYISVVTFFLGLVLIFFVREVGGAVAILSLVTAIALNRKYGIIRTTESIKLQLKNLGLTQKTLPNAIQEIESLINKELAFYADQQKELDFVKFMSKAFRSQWMEGDAATLAFAKDAFQNFLTPQKSDEWETYDKKQRFGRIVEQYGQDFHNWAILQSSAICLKEMKHIDFLPAMPGGQKLEGSDDRKRFVFMQQFLGPALLKRFNDPDKIQQEYESAVELREHFAIWMNPEQHKSDWLDNEAKRVELMQKASTYDREAISALCEALLPLPIDVAPPSWVDASSLQEYEVAYHVETPEEAWLLIELPDVAIIPEYAAQLSPGGNSLTYPVMTERNRFTLYDKCAASFSLIHAQFLYLTFPFFKKIWIEAYTMAVDSATGMPRRKDIVQGYIDTENFAKFNFNNADPVEAIKALKVNFFPFSTKQFVEPTWADDDKRIIWASRDDDVPDGLLPF